MSTKMSKAEFIKLRDAYALKGKLIDAEVGTNPKVHNCLWTEMVKNGLVFSVEITDSYTQATMETDENGVTIEILRVPIEHHARLWDLFIATLELKQEIGKEYD